MADNVPPDRADHAGWLDAMLGPRDLAAWLDEMLDALDPRPEPVHRCGPWCQPYTGPIVLGRRDSTGQPVETVTAGRQPT